MNTLSISTEGTHIIHSENNKKRNYTKKNPPIVAKISLHMKGQVTMEDYLKCIKEIKSTPPVNIIRDIKNIASCSAASWCVC